MWVKLVLVNDLTSCCFVEQVIVVKGGEEAGLYFLCCGDASQALFKIRCCWASQDRLMLMMEKIEDRRVL